ncbi:hypothetical protein BH11PSE8_BH11PSE8_07960 [soil metagenome]
MNQAQPKQYFAANHRAVAYGGGIDWEETPSLAQRLVTRTQVPAAAQRPQKPPRDADFTASSAFDSAWDSTVPASLEERAQPFQDLLDGGLATREVNEPEVFRHFFGAVTQG